MTNGLGGLNQTVKQREMRTLIDQYLSGRGIAPAQVVRLAREGHLIDLRPYFEAEDTEGFEDFCERAFEIIGV